MKITAFLLCFWLLGLQAQQDCFRDWTFVDNNLSLPIEDSPPQVVCIELDSAEQAGLCEQLRKVWERKDKYPFFNLNEEPFSGYLDAKLPNGNFIFQGLFKDGSLQNYGYFVLPKIPEVPRRNPASSTMDAPSNNQNNKRYLPLRERYVKPNFRQ